MATFQPTINASEQSSISMVDVSRPSKSVLGEKVCRILQVFLAALTTYNLLDAGLARFFALETLVHGTNPMAFLGVNKNGALPMLGGNLQGSSAAMSSAFVRESRGFFHMFKDSGLEKGYARGSIEVTMLSVCQFVVPLLKNHKSLARAAYEPVMSFATILSKFSFVKYHAMLSTIAAFIGPLPSRDIPALDGLKYILAGIIGLLTPVLKFRFKPDEAKTLRFNAACTESLPTRFDNDPCYGGLAYRTEHKISPYRLGITGALTQGIGSDMGERMKANIKKVVSGIVLLFGALYTVRVTYQYLKQSDEASSSQEAEMNGTRASFLRSGKTIAACLLVTVLNSFLNTL